MRSNIKRGLFLCVLLLFMVVPHETHLEPCFDVTCGHLRKVVIIELRHGDAVVVFHESTRGKNEFAQFTRANLGKDVCISYQDALFLEGYVHSNTMQLPNISLPSKEEAHRAAMDICPSYVHVIPYSADERMKPTSRPEKIVGNLFEVSCSNVLSIEIITQRDMIWQDPTMDDHYYIIYVRLLPEAGKQLMQLLETAPEVWVGEKQHTKRKYVQLAVNGQRIVSDAPMHDGFSEEEVVITKRSFEDSLKIATSICKRKVVKEMKIQREIGIEIVELPLD